jgi:hypothetical protein
LYTWETLRKISNRLLEMVVDSAFRRVGLTVRQMISSPTKLTFQKTAACPASATLLSFRTAKLPRKIAATVREHLGGCEFCNAELRLLAHHEPARRRFRTPELPMNLRILAESILSHKVG